MVRNGDVMDKKLQDKFVKLLLERVHDALLNLEGIDDENQDALIELRLDFANLLTDKNLNIKVK